MSDQQPGANGEDPGIEADRVPADSERSKTPTRPGSVTPKVTKWVVGIVVAALGTFLTAQLTGGLQWVKNTVMPPPAITPISVTVTPKPTCPYVFTVPPGEVQQRFDEAMASNPGAELSAAGPIQGTETTLEITVQGRSAAQAVVLSDLRAHVVKRSAPSGFATAGCGGEQPVRLFSVDLDSPAATAVPQPDTSSGAPAPAEFKLRVSATDPEVLHVTARTAHCDCLWTLLLTWTSGDESKTTEIDDHGKPFRTVGIDGLPRYYLNTDNKIVPAG